MTVILEYDGIYKGHIVFFGGAFFHFSLTGQWRWDRKWVGERWGGWYRERSTMRDSILGHPRHNCTNATTLRAAGAEYDTSVAKSGVFTSGIRLH